MKYILSLQGWDPELAKWIQKLQVGCSNFGDPKTDDSCKKAAEFLYHWPVVTLVARL